MNYQTQVRPWCIVRQASGMAQVVVDRCRHYQEAEARVKVLDRQAPNVVFTVVFNPSSQTPAKSDPVQESRSGLLSQVS